VYRELRVRVRGQSGDHAGDEEGDRCRAAGLLGGDTEHGEDPATTIPPMRIAIAPNRVTFAPSGRRLMALCHRGRNPARGDAICTLVCTPTGLRDDRFARRRDG
jgi:hypothetical protein